MTPGRATASYRRLLDGATDGESVSAFRKARELLQRDGRRCRDFLPGPATGAAAGNGGAPRREAAEILALRGRVAELERLLGRADARVESAERGLARVEDHLDGLHRKYRTALERKDRAIARLHRRLAEGAPAEDGPGNGAPSRSG